MVSHQLKCIEFLLRVQRPSQHGNTKPYALEGRVPSTMSPCFQNTRRPRMSVAAGRAIPSVGSSSVVLEICCRERARVQPDRLVEWDDDQADIHHLLSVIITTKG
ncbi:hypothetical protein CKAN_00232600 [Cinnamomum micranthum f. kanehirae]|uniref:Uncharacterized protein n=1 Tax=Cinnamomum micranthum f. kanehirae TaxID=337451 RepID=A0A443N675_9MAGN|nr:hypothetical protein CKAN_00232600 [Cinnamomum micranthum f. kanehirae]